MVCTAEYFIRKTDITIEPVMAPKDLEHKTGANAFLLRKWLFNQKKVITEENLLFLTLQTIKNSISNLIKDTP